MLIFSTARDQDLLSDFIVLTASSRGRNPKRAQRNMWALRPSEKYMGILPAEFKMETASILRLLPSNQLRSASPSRTLQLMLRIRPPENLNFIICLLRQERNFEATSTIPTVQAFNFFDINCLSILIDP